MKFTRKQLRRIIRETLEEVPYLVQKEMKKDFQRWGNFVPDSRETDVYDSLESFEDSHGYQPHKPPDKKWDSLQREQEFLNLSFEEQSAYEEGSAAALAGENIVTNPKVEPHNKHLADAWEMGWFSEMTLPSDRKGY